MTGIIFNIIYGTCFMSYLFIDSQFQLDCQDILYRICLIYIINTFVMFNLIYLFYLILSGF